MTTDHHAKTAKAGQDRHPVRGLQLPRPDFEVPAAFRDFAEKSVSRRATPTPR